MANPNYSNELWRDIPGYEGFYQASSFGRIKSLARSTPTRNRWGPCRYNQPEKIIEGRIDEYGYRRMSLCVAGERKDEFAHKLVALAFLGPCPAHCTQVAHWDGNKQNNRPENIRWATAAENSADKVRHGQTANQFGENHSHNTLTEEQVRAIHSAKWERSTAASLAAQFGVHAQTIRKIRRGDRWPHMR